MDWAYRRRPLATAILVLVLAFPFAANIDTGNINLVLVLMLWAAQFVGPVSSGLLWALATWMKWVPAPFWLVLAPAARGWGLVWLAISAGLSLVMLPLTIVQLETLFGFGPRPVRLDYLIYLWALVPWWWRHPDPLWWLRPSAWPGMRARAGTTLDRWRGWFVPGLPAGIRTSVGASYRAARRWVGLESAEGAPAAAADAPGGAA